MVKQRKTEHVRATVEPLVLAAIEAAARAEGMSISNYMRRTVIRDLRNRGLLPDKILADLAEAS